MPVRDRRASQRASVLALLMLLTTAVAGGPIVLAGEPAAALPVDPTEPREIEPGQTPGFRLPYAAGLAVSIDQGWHTSFSHAGKAGYAYDFGLYDGTPVLASARGVVSYVHAGETACGGPELLLKANYVTIDHPDGSSTQYGHLSAVDVEVGAVVAQGQQIGRSGRTGYTGCQPHLHFARQVQGGAVTTSLPVYFEGYADRAFESGEVVAAPAAACDDPIKKPTPASPADALTGLFPDREATKAPGKAGARKAKPLVKSRPLGFFCGTYFSGTFDGPALFSRRDALINFDWREAGPGGYWLDSPTAGYSVRWSGRFAFSSSGRYTLGLFATGHVRVTIDGIAVVDHSFDEETPIEVVLQRSIGAGIHDVEVEHLATTGQSVLKLGWGRSFAEE